MRLATLNVWGIRGDWEARLPLFQKGFRELDADALTLQETILTEDVDQVTAMLGDGYHLAHSSERESDGQGITTASRWPIGEVLELDLNVTGPDREPGDVVGSRPTVEQVVDEQLRCLRYRRFRDRRRCARNDQTQ